MRRIGGGGIVATMQTTGNRNYELRNRDHQPWLSRAKTKSQGQQEEGSSGTGKNVRMEDDREGDKGSVIRPVGGFLLPFAVYRTLYY